MAIETVYRVGASYELEDRGIEVTCVSDGIIDIVQKRPRSDEVTEIHVFDRDLEDFIKALRLALKNPTVKSTKKGTK